ncbi:MAG TPA: hypothetical protein VFB79_07265 [Candidatus Angelobacter sp.]|nr:hypothetical protein [Candidatus Angelobacter sp.]
MAFSFTATVTLDDGSTAQHTAEALAYRHEADGSISVTAACCGLYGGELCDGCGGAGCAKCNNKGVFAVAGMESTISRHTFYDTGMSLSDGSGGTLPPIDPKAELMKHVQAVAERHAARHKARSSGLDQLVKTSAVADGSEGENPAVTQILSAAT